MSAAELVAEHGSPLWLADVDAFRQRLAEFRACWERSWPASTVAYSYKTNRLPAFLRAAEAEGAAPEVVCGVEYELAADVVCAAEAEIVVNGPAKPEALLRRAGEGDSLVLVDSEAELDRAAAAGVRRVGLRVALASFTGATTRFGIAPERIARAARRAVRLGLSLEALSTHLVSTDFDPEASSGGAPGTSVVVAWPRPPGEHAAAARALAGLANELSREGMEIELLDLGGGLPPAPALEAVARGVAAELAAAGFEGRLLLEPGRAVVAEAVDLAFSVVSVKELAAGSRCLVCDAGTHLLPGALHSPPRIEAARAGAPSRPALVSGPLCLNVDVLHRAAVLPEVAPGDVLVARGVGAYQEVASTQFGEPRPAVVAREAGLWRPCRRAERLDDMLEREVSPEPAVEA